MFKPGDKIICIDSSGTVSLTKSKVYTFIEYLNTPPIGIPHVRIKEHNLGWVASRFKLHINIVNTRLPSFL